MLVGSLCGLVVVSISLQACACSVQRRSNCQKSLQAFGQKELALGDPDLDIRAEKPCRQKHLLMLQPLLRRQTVWQI